MKQLIVIKTSNGREQWAKQIMESLSGYNKYPIVLFKSEDYYMKGALEYFNVDEFIFLHDSLVITDTSMFDKCFEEWKGKSVAFCGQTNSNDSVFVPYTLGMGKFKPQLARKIPYPWKINSDRDDSLYEAFFGHEYFNLDPDCEVLIPDFTDKGEVIDIFGQTRKKIITPYFIKYQRGSHEQSINTIPMHEYKDWERSREKFSNYV